MQPAGLCVSLSAARLLEDEPQRALRRLGQRTLRIGRQRMLLGPRLRAFEEYGESEGMFERSAVVYNSRLKDTSSWANFYLDRDHSAPPTPPVDESEKK